MQNSQQKSKAAEEARKHANQVDMSTLTMQLSNKTRTSKYLNITIIPQITKKLDVIIVLTISYQALTLQT